MAKKTYVCSKCHHESVYQMTICPGCNSKNSFIPKVEVEKQKATVKPSIAGISTMVRPQLIQSVQPINNTLLDTGVSEFNRVMGGGLGGGLVSGSVTIIGGAPGIGKTTLLTQISALISQRETVLYVSGEESEGQVKMRFDRLGLDSNQLYVVYETDVDQITNNHIPSIKPSVVIVDSISAMGSADKTGDLGSLSQAVYALHQLRYVAKSTGVIFVIVGQVTKEGVIAGSNKLNHDVDTVLYLEGDEYGFYRILRSPKNRFGDTGEIGVFEMSGSGLIEVKNPSEAFLASRDGDKSGSSITVTLEGKRPIVLEIQALCVPTANVTASRKTSGINRDRLHLITAVMDKYLRYVQLYDSDIFLSVVGGLRVNEPAADLSVAASLLSSWHNVAIPNNVALIGEVGLTGEIRMVQNIEPRIREARNLGFTRIIVPPTKRGYADDVIVCSDLDTAMRACFEDRIVYEVEKSNLTTDSDEKPNKKYKTHRKMRGDEIMEVEYYDE